MNLRSGEHKIRGIDPTGEEKLNPELREECRMNVEGIIENCSSQEIYYIKRLNYSNACNRNRRQASKDVIREDCPHIIIHNEELAFVIGEISSCSNA